MILSNNMLSFKKVPKSAQLLCFLRYSYPAISKYNKFSGILKFLITERRALEYGQSDIRFYRESKSGKVNEISSYKAPKDSNAKPHCLIHNTEGHVTSECRVYLQMSLNEKYNLLKANFASYTCLEPNHLSIDCPSSKACGIEYCEMKHHHLHRENVNSNNCSIREDSSRCLLPVMSVSVKNRRPIEINVFWDSGSTVSLIRNSIAKDLRLKGTPVTMNITTVGGVEQKNALFRYQVPLLDKNNHVKIITAYGIDVIANVSTEVDRNVVSRCFGKDEGNELTRPCGQIDLLVGYEYAAWHPVQIKATDHLLLLSNIFGKCVAGRHKTVRECPKELINANISHVSLSEFFSIESMGVCYPSKCDKCPRDSSNLTLKEVRELAQIDKNLTLVEDHFEARYPWIKDPFLLPNNYNVAKKVRIFLKASVKAR